MAGIEAVAPAPAIKRGPGRPPKSQTTATAPAPVASAPSPAAAIATGDTSSPSSPPPAPVTPKAPTKGNSNTPTESAKDTSAETQAAFEAALREIDEADETKDVQKGKAEKGKETAPPLKGEGKDKAKEEDVIQAELDAEEAAKDAPKGEDKDTSEESVEEEQKPEEVEPPDVSDKEAYDSWIKTLSKPAAKKIEQQRSTIGKLKEAAAERIVVAPTIEAPLSHVTNLEQLEAEKGYWSNVRDLIRKGEAFTIKGADGKKLELDPENEEDAPKIERYREWSDAALDAVPDAKERIKTRATGKPWETAEKLAPGIVSDNDSFAAKQAVKFLRANPSLLQLPDYEVHVAHMVRSMQMDEDATPADGYAKGKAKWVRIPLDKDGNVIPPKKAVATKESGRKPTVNDTKPVTQVRRETVVDASEAFKRADTERSDDSFRDLVRAEELAASGRRAS